MKSKSGISVACVIAALLLNAIDARAGTVTVTNGNDSGQGSLRQAIVNASLGDTISFAPSVTIVNLTSAQLVIDKNLSIVGPGANRLTVQRSSNAPEFRIFHITSSTVNVSISGITISNGISFWDFRCCAGFLSAGGGIWNAGVLTLSDSTISGNQATFGGGGGGVVNDNGYHDHYALYD